MQLGLERRASSNRVKSSLCEVRDVPEHGLLGNLIISLREEGAEQDGVEVEKDDAQVVVLSEAGCSS